MKQRNKWYGRVYQAIETISTQQPETICRYELSQGYKQHDKIIESIKCFYRILTNLI